SLPFPNRGATHLTLPALRAGPLPLPRKRAERGKARVNRHQMVAAPSLTPHWADPNQVNDGWLQPRIGHAEMTPAGAFEAGSYASLTIIYTAGYFGIDDTGAVR